MYFAPTINKFQTRKNKQKTNKQADARSLIVEASQRPRCATRYGVSRQRQDRWNGYPAVQNSDGEPSYARI